MAEVKYKVVKRTLGGFVSQKKYAYMPRISSTGSVDKKSLGRQIATESTISENEAKRFVEGFVMVIQEMLINGDQVKLEKLGLFSPSFKAKGVEEANECDERTISGKTITYTPSVEMKNELKAVKFRRVNLDVSHI